MSEWREQAVVFECGTDRLVGIVHQGLSERPARIGVLIVVGGPQYRVGSHRQFVLMARALAAAGIPVMRFDYRGMGDSEGPFRGFEFVEEDLRAAIDAFMGAVSSLSQVALWGLCDAASAVLMHGVRDPRVGALILANPWVRTQSGEARTILRHYYWERFFQRGFWRKLLTGGINPFGALKGMAQTAATARSQAVASSFIERMQAGLATFRGPILLLVSEHDLTAQEFVDLCAASAPWQRALSRSNVRTEKLAGADHTFSQRAALDLAAEHTLRVVVPLAF